MRCQISAGHTRDDLEFWNQPYVYQEFPKIGTYGLHVTRNGHLTFRVADHAMRTFGGWGFSTDHPIERIYRDSLGNVPGGLTTDRLREFLACPMVGADPWTYEAFDWLAPSGLDIP